MSGDLSQQDFFVAGLAQALYSGMTLQEVLRCAMDAKDAQHFDCLIDTFVDYTIEPEFIDYTSLFR